MQDIHIITISDGVVEAGKVGDIPTYTDSYCIYIQLAGRATHRLDCQEIDMEVGDVFVISPGQVHKFLTRAGFDGVLIYFPAAFFYQNLQNKVFLENAQIFNTIGLLVKIYFDTENLDDLLFMVEKLKSELVKPYDKFQSTILNNFLSNILFTLERRWTDLLSANKLFHHRYSKDYAYVASYRKLIKEEFRDFTKVKYYAGKLNISERKLQKVVMKLLGKSPKVLIDEYVILESKRLLVHESMNVKEVAYALGFDEPSYFTKFFKTKVGIAPRQFKSQNRLTS